MSAQHGPFCKCEDCDDRARGEASRVPELEREVARLQGLLAESVQKHVMDAQAFRDASEATRARLAALEAFAAAFAGIEFIREDEGAFAVCWECGGMKPEDFDEGWLHRPANAERGHRSDCARGAAVAALKETTT